MQVKESAASFLQKSSRRRSFPAGASSILNINFGRHRLDEIGGGRAEGFKLKERRDFF